MLKRLLLCVVALAFVACAAPMTSTAVLQERRQDGGTVRIVCPGYPPDAAAQDEASAKMSQVCGPRAWKVVDINLKDLRGPSGITCVGEICGYAPGTRGQQLDLAFTCVAK